MLIIISCSVSKKTVKEDQRTTNYKLNSFFLEALRQEALENYGESLNLLQHALKVDNKNSAIYYKISQLLALNNDYAGSLDFAKKAVEYDKTNNEYYLSMLGLTYYNNSKIDETIEVYKKLLKLYPQNNNYYLQLAGFYTIANKTKEAINVLDKLEEQIGVTEFISRAKEDFYLSIKDTNGAIKEIKKLVAAYPDNPQCLVILAELYLNTGNITEAGKVYSQLEQIDPDNIENEFVYFSTAEYQRMSNNMDKFFENIAKGFAMEGGEFKTKAAVLVNVIENMNYFKPDANYNEKTKSLIDILAVNNPEETLISAFYADYYINIGDLKSAQGYFDTILSNKKDEHQIWEQALRIDYELSDMESVYKHSKEACELYPNYLLFYKYYVISAYATKNYADVVEAVDIVTSIDSKDKDLLIDMWGMQGDAYHNLNMYEQSDAAYNKVLNIDNKNSHVLNNYSYYLSVREENLSKALELSTKLMSIDNNNTNPIFLDTHAWVLYKNGKYEKALEYIEKALALDPNNDTYHEHKEEILQKIE